MTTHNTRSRKRASARLDHVVLIGNHTPRQCGIATFTADVAQALPARRVSVVAMNDGQNYDYPPQVVLGVEQNDLSAYVEAARRINAMRPDAVCVQHEYGIYGGPAGSYLLTLLRGLNAPIVTTLHTVLETPDAAQKAVFDELCALSAAIVVMSTRALDILANLGVPASKIHLIHHGIPEIDLDGAAEKARLGVGTRPLVLTFGLLGRGKGLETAIRALPEVVAAQPDALYLILGATHPHVLRHEGEAYREELWQLARELGVEEHLRMDNRFVELDDLKRYLAAADVYLTPYPNPAQITSGTLAYAVGNGKAVVSTPYWYAEELLADGRGVLTPFGDPAAMGQAVGHLLGDEEERRRLGERAAAFGQAMRWPAVGQAYADVLTGMMAAPLLVPRPVAMHRPVSVRLDHLEAMTDSTGLFQHATGTIPNPHEGYTTDDNARLLGLMARLDSGPQSTALARRALAFLHYALDPVSGVFRNFLDYDRRWLETVGAENAQARAIRGLVTAALSRDEGLANAATELLRRARLAATGLESPRAQAIALLAAADAFTSPVLRAELAPLIEAASGYAANLARIHRESAQDGWNWFENYLSYANAELSHGLIAWGAAVNDAGSLNLGLSTLDWLHTQQRGPLPQSAVSRMGFWPIGCTRVYVRGEARPLWDGQPIEAAVSVAAYSAAWNASRDPVWAERAQRALDWLLGDNLRGEALLDPLSGGCRDGLHSRGPSINQGAESTVLAWEAVLDLNLLTAETQRGQGLTDLDSLTSLSADD
ncbi:glycosyltransferase family 4 protein (plasmid) [Deinococcus sp. KNUC1210]|uniref:glycosyltransferase family 4 protein n=1 Tax=Deinococcus sp. KNUC1210 TaxID=2917691 RepID=UPI001EF0EA0B|nr:glycosyltransferase family 4 protein [Deinococcus sp. KNUC1210]ULH17209.1 glycosyltransferase family 4 protein [Deinococcus sp. KNUC1210]